MTGIKLLHVVGDSSFGGAAKVILRLAQMAKAEGWQVDILTTNPIFRRAAKSQGMRAIDLDVIRRPIRPARDLAGLVRLCYFLRRESYTVVHTHTSKAGFVGRLAARLVRVPLIIHTCHGFAFHERSPWRARAFYSALERTASRWCDQIVFVNEFHKSWAVELGIGSADQMTAIPNGIVPPGVALESSWAQLRRHWKAHPSELVVLNIGRLAPEKGLEHLLQAASILQRSGQRFRFVIAGDGPLRTQLERLAIDLGVSGCVTFLGYRQDVGRLLAASDLVALPSLREGLSIALLEAMAAGKPIVMTSIGSNLSVASRAKMALLVPPGDAQALSNAILQCGHDHWLSARLGMNARRLYEAHYTEDRMLNSYRQLYFSLLQAKCPAVVSRETRPAQLARSFEA